MNKIAKNVGRFITVFAASAATYVAVYTATEKLCHYLYQKKIEGVAEHKNKWGFISPFIFSILIIKSLISHSINTIKRG